MTAINDETDVIQTWRNNKCVKGVIGVVALLLTILLTAVLASATFFECNNCFSGGDAVFGLLVLSTFVVVACLVLLSYLLWRRRIKKRQHVEQDSQARELSEQGVHPQDQVDEEDMVNVGTHSEIEEQQSAMSEQQGDQHPQDAATEDEQAIAGDIEEEGGDRSDFPRFIRTFLVWWIVLPILLGIFFQLLLFESLLAWRIPNSSLFPKKAPYTENALTTDPASQYAPKHCNASSIEARFDNALNFYQNSTDFGGHGTQIFYLPYRIPGIGAFVFDQTIYLPRGSCPSTRLLVHELVHVYQFHVGYFSFNRAVGYIRNYDSDSYDYGGYPALQSKMEQAIDTNDAALLDIHSSFGVEQMASIVDDYYFETTSGPCLQYAPPEYCKALAFYALQIVDPSRWKVLYEQS